MPLELDTLTASSFGRRLIGTGRTSEMLTLESLLKEKLKGVPSRTPRHIPRGTLWPDGTWSLGFAKTAVDDDQSANSTLPWYYMGPFCDLADRPPGGVPLDLRNLSNSHKYPSCPLKPRGSKGITGYGRKMIRGAGALLNRSGNVGPSTFATITLPQLDRGQRLALVERWPEFLRQLIQHLCRQLGRLGLPRVVLSVTEIQGARLEQYGEAYPHLHLLWPNKPGAQKGSWSIDVDSLKCWVKSCLERLTGSCIDGYLNIDVRPVRGSVAAYMTKYMSKGPGAVAKARADWDGQTIKQWWNMSGPARQWVKTETMKGAACGEFLEMLLQNTWEDGDFRHFIWLRNVDLPYNGGMVTVGWRGCITDEVRDYLTGVLKSD